MGLTYEGLPASLKDRVDSAVAALRAADPGLPLELARARVIDAWVTVTVHPAKGH